MQLGSTVNWRFDCPCTKRRRCFRGLRTRELRGCRGDEERREQGEELRGWPLLAGLRCVHRAGCAELLVECTHAAAVQLHSLVQLLVARTRFKSSRRESGGARKEVCGTDPLFKLRNSDLIEISIS